jgi:Protein of unknown function (DUF3365)
MTNIQLIHYLPGCASSKRRPSFSGQVRWLLRRSALICLILAGGGLSGCAEGIDSGTDSEQAAEDLRIEASRTIANRLQIELGARLKSALAAGGPVQAITVCQLEAPAIAHALEAEGGPSYVGRTALKVRNPANGPDDEARAVLANFEHELSPNAPPPSRFITQPDGSARYLQAIPMQPLCIGCHGSELSTEVSDALAQRYPQDEATGFAVGELRGAFLIEWPAGDPGN